MEKLVDILVTTYNTNEKYLRKQIESILRQTYKNINIYISDDHSTDNNIGTILKKYAESDERIKLYIQPKNLGYNKNFEFHVLDELRQMDYVDDHTVIIVEASKETSFDYLDQFGYEMIKRKEYKTNMHIFIQKK